MRISTSAFLMCMVTSATLAGAGGNIGLVDDRSYGSLQDPLYSAIGRISIGCTAGFIDTNLIITNKHCFDACRNCTVEFWDGQQMQNSPITPILIPKQTQEQRQHQNSNGTDWAIYKTDIPNPNFKNVATETILGPVNRGGFGLLRVIKDEEIPILKQIYSEQTRLHQKECAEKNQNDPGKSLSCVHKYVTDELKRRGIEPLFDDSKKFKIQTCNIHTFKDQRKAMTLTNCDSAGGDSGAPLLRGNTIVALNNSGPQTVFGKDEEHGASALNTSNFYRAVQEAKRRVTSTPTQPIQEPTPGTPPTTINDPTKIQQLQEQFLQDFQCD